MCRDKRQNGSLSERALLLTRALSFFRDDERMKGCRVPMIEHSCLVPLDYIFKHGYSGLLAVKTWLETPTSSAGVIVWHIKSPLRTPCPISECWFEFWLLP